MVLCKLSVLRHPSNLDNRGARSTAFVVGAGDGCVAFFFYLFFLFSFSLSLGGGPI